MQGREINITYISDENYAVITAVSINSLRMNRNRKDLYHIHFISVNVSKEIICKLKQMEEPNFLIDVIPFEINENEYKKEEVSATPAAVAKFFLPDLLPELEKVIYLDGDMVVQKDLGKLYETSLDDSYAAVVRDIWIEKGNNGLLRKLNCGIKRYFNSGMMVLNLKRMREENIPEQLIEYRKNGINYHMDQDALNVVFKDEVKCLPYLYNYMPAMHEAFSEEQIYDIYGIDTACTSCEVMSEAVIIHFIGLDNKNKPWRVYVPYLTDLFMKYYRSTPFAEDGYYDMKQIKQNIKAQYLFPFELVPQNSRIAIWGAGQVGRVFYRQIEATQYCIVVAWADKRAAKTDDKLIDPELLTGLDVEYVVIAIKRESVAEEIRDQLRKMGFSEDKIIWRYPVIF